MVVSPERDRDLRGHRRQIPRRVDRISMVEIVEGGAT